MLKTARTPSKPSSEGTTAASLAVAYCIGRDVPTSRMPSLRFVLREHLDACAALIEGVPIAQHLAKVDAYLERLHHLRSRSLPSGDWRLDVLDWLRHDGRTALHLHAHAAGSMLAG